MCGIAGIVGDHDIDLLERMTDLLEHRGPDDAGVYHDRGAGVSLGMRRLSILDLEGGHQPMTNEDGSLWIVFNGEIYNAPELRPGLVERGHEFRTSHSDTEILLHLYEERGTDMLNAINGMFAFVVYDQRRGILWGARDRVGIKPFYYVDAGGRFAFSSELKALLPLPWVSRDIDSQAVYDYMSLLYVAGEQSILRDVRKLLPGHLFEYDLRSRRLSIRRYWNLRFDTIEKRREEEWTELLRDEMRRAVRRWTLSDVPIACSLSGGIDSSSIVGLLAESGFSRIKTYTLGFTGAGEEEWNELPLARSVAQRWGTEHHELILEPQQLLSDLLRMVWYLDEPYGGGLPSWYVFQFMSHDVKVGLTGTGGDELFGNYGKFRGIEKSAMAQWTIAGGGRQLKRMAAGVEKPLRQLVLNLPFVPMRRKQHWVDLPSLFDDPLRYHYFDSVYYFSDAIKKNLVLTVSPNGAFDTWQTLRQVFDEAGTNDVRDGLAYLDFKTQLPEEFLLMTDRFSMAHSIEARVPFLDHELIESVFRMPSSIRTNPRDLKGMMKRAVADLLPPEILSARKRGFVIPIGLWLRTKLRSLTERLLSPHRLAKQGLFRPEFYEQFVQPHLGGAADHTWQVWAAVMFQLWHIVFVEERMTAVPSGSIDTLLS